MHGLSSDVPVIVHCTVTVGVEADALGAVERMPDAQPESNAPKVNMQAHFQSEVICIFLERDGLAQVSSSNPWKQELQSLACRMQKPRA